ncbi:MAG TPA: zf-HC2 domain-containing protein, partial [Thermoanaerobaculia bacterium]
MTGEHFDDAELAAFDDGNATAEEVAAITAHLASCRECSDNLQDVRSLTALLRDPAVHLFSDRRRTRPAPSRIADAQAVFRRREQERQHAETTFAELMTRPLDAWLPYLEEQPERQTEALVERIIAE